MTGKQKKPFVLTSAMREDQRRGKEREALFAALPDCPAKQALRIAMLEAAFDLLENHDDRSTKESDTIMEFMATNDAMKMWEQFFETDKPFDASAFPAPKAHEFVCEARRLFGCHGADGQEVKLGPYMAAGSKNLRRKRLYARRKRPSLYPSSYR